MEYWAAAAEAENVRPLNRRTGLETSRNAEASSALIVGDVGQGAREEINYEPAGAVRRANTCPILRDRPIRGVPFTAHPR
jgi:hypothetical protein